MKKNIQKLTLIFVLFGFSAVAAFAGNVQCPIAPTPTPTVEFEYFETTTETMPENTLQTIPENESPTKLPDFLQQVIDTLYGLL